MHLKQFIFIVILQFSFCCCLAQTDSIFQTLQNLQQVPVKYLNAVENKIDKYSNRITGKTEKTLAKLSKWEKKIKNILDQVSPETSAKLFGNNATTFGSLLKKIQEGKAVAAGYRAKYNSYRDKLATSVKYLEDQKDQLDKKLIQPINSAKKKLEELEQDVSNSEAVEQFIKERKKQLMNEAVKYIGKSKYLAKIDKEAYYYVETLRNYKELFSDRKKVEVLALKVLNKIPAFKNFVKQNSMLASLFRLPSEPGAPLDLRGLQTRESVNALIQNRIGSGGPNAVQAFNQNMQQAQTELRTLKDKVLKGGGSSSDANIPDFKPNMQKTKTFVQRLEYGSIFDFEKSNNYIPTIANIGVSVGYKLNDKSVIGIGVNYKMGLGSIQRIRISHQGLGFRSFVDWKLKKQFFVTGGFEMNYNATFNQIEQLKDHTAWQQSGLVGLTKKISFKSKLAKGTKVQLLYNMLYRQQ
ncbi:MAG: hypothetical protein WAT20_00285, partial [Ferruginibacter sp.]